MENLLEIKNITLKFGDKIVLDDISFNIKCKEIVTIIGPNGSGKSSLIKTIIGKYKPSSGHINKNTNVRFGYVPQKFETNSLPNLKVKEFLRLYNCDIDNGYIKNILNKEISKLSGGELQKVLFIRALHSNPNILIMDEPTQGIDLDGIKDFYEMVDNIKQTTDIAILLSSHDLTYVMKNTDRVICLNKHICCEGKPDQVAENNEFIRMYGAGYTSPYTHNHNHKH